MKGRKPLIRVVASSFFVRLISHGLGIIGFLLLLAIFDASQFGRYSLVISFGLILSPAMNAALHLPMMRFMSGHGTADHRKQVTSGYSILLLGWWSFWLVVGFAVMFLSQLADYVLIPSLIFYSICIASEIAVSHFLLSIERPVASAALTSGPRNIAICVIAGGAFMMPTTPTQNYYWFIWIPTGFTIFINLLILATQINLAAPKRSVDYFLKCLKPSEIRNVQAASLTNGMIAQLNANLMIVGSAVVFSDALVGVLAVARRLLNILELVITSLLMPSLMKITRHLQSGQKKTLSRYMGKLAGVMFALAVCFNICVWLIGAWDGLLSGVIADPRALDALKMMAAAFLVSTLFGPTFLAVQVSHAAWVSVWANLISICLNFILVAAVFFGLIGEDWFVVGIGVIMIAHQAIMYYMFRVKTNIRSDILAMTTKGG